MEFSWSAIPEPPFSDCRVSTRVPATRHRYTRVNACVDALRRRPSARASGAPWCSSGVSLGELTPKCELYGNADMLPLMMLAAFRGSSLSNTGAVCSMGRRKQHVLAFYPGVAVATPNGDQM